MKKLTLILLTIAAAYAAHAHAELYRCKNPQGDELIVPAEQGCPPGWWISEVMPG